MSLFCSGKEERRERQLLPAAWSCPGVVFVIDERTQRGADTGDGRASSSSPGARACVADPGPESAGGVAASA